MGGGGCSRPPVWGGGGGGRPAGPAAGASFVVAPLPVWIGATVLPRPGGGDILAALDLITFSLQAAKQFFQVGTGWQESVNGSFQLCLIAGAVLRSLMFNIALALVLSGDDDRQTVFLAKPVGGAADIVITPLVGMIVLVIRKADRIENQVVMNMIFVYMGGKDKLILAAQDFFLQAPCRSHGPVPA